MGRVKEGLCPCSRVVWRVMNRATKKSPGLEVGALLQGGGRGYLARAAACSLAVVRWMCHIWMMERAWETVQ